MSSRVDRYAGTEITGDEARAGRYLLARYETELRYSWSSGDAISRFLTGLREGEIWGRRCSGCERTMVPPRMYCEACFRPTDDWVRLKDTGRIATYSVSHVNADASRREGEQPILVAVVEVDGASPKMGILHLLGEFSPDEPAVGRRVKAVWKPRGKRTGAITDIVYFRPLDEGAGGL
jgi:uncharacterized protein